MSDTQIHTARVRWQANISTWWVEPFVDGRQGEAVSLIEWAEQLGDESQVRLLLSASNYSVHWVSLPGVSKRHLARAIPFALEESLIGELDEINVLPHGKEDGKTKAYVASQPMLDQLLELCRSYHLRVICLVPETSLLAASSQLLADGDGWLTRIPGLLEGRIDNFSVGAVLDSALADYSGDTLTLHCQSRDQGELLKTNLEVASPDAFQNIQIELGSNVASLSHDLWPAKPLSFISGAAEGRAGQSRKPAAWYRPLAAMAACWLLLVGAWLVVDNHQLEQRSDEIRQASVTLYKKLFPGERVGALERSMRSKLSEEDGGAVEGGFIGLTNRTAAAFASSSITNLNISSMRFNERQQELLVEVLAGSLTDLQALQKALESKGLGAEIASANNEKEGVKGRLKIRESA